MTTTTKRDGGKDSMSDVADLRRALLSLSVFDPIERALMADAAEDLGEPFAAQLLRGVALELSGSNDAKWMTDVAYLISQVGSCWHWWNAWLMVPSLACGNSPTTGQSQAYDTRRDAVEAAVRFAFDEFMYCAAHDMRHNRKADDFVCNLYWYADGSRRAGDLYRGDERITTAIMLPNSIDGAAFLATCQGDSRLWAIGSNRRG